MRVFVLCTGRCGSVTFAHSCEHITNYTATHEGNAGRPPSTFLDFPDQHIEVNNRLSWFLGPLGERYPDARYVHLRRDPEAVARSFAARWDADPLRSRWHPRQPFGRLKRRLTQGYPGSIGPAFAYAMMKRSVDWPAADRIELCRFYVATVTSNIETFLVGKPSLSIDLETAPEQLGQFWEFIGAAGDLDLARTVFSQRFNATG